MKLILISRVKTLGGIGDVCTVADGYGKNFLLPKKLAVIYSPKNVKSLEEKKKLLEATNLLNRKKAEEIKARLEGQELVMGVNAGENGNLYGSLNALKIANFANQLLEEKYLDKTSVFLQEPIKMLGKFMVEFRLHADVILTKELAVIRAGG
jgi:large subunit ribosomal protein L9